MRQEIVPELVRLLTTLRASPDVLAVVNSWGDTLNDDEVLELLRSYNEHGSVWRQVYVERPPTRPDRGS